MITKKLTTAQARTLQNIIKLTDAGFRKWSCVTNYKPAMALLALGYVKRVGDLASEYRMTLEPTAEGRAAAAG
jgi:DNA-binding MarR family transcriptional regulator